MTNSVPFIDLKRQFSLIENDIRAAIDRVLANQIFIMGSEVLEFEAEISDYLDVGFAVGVSSGTDALLIALMALEIGPDDEIIVPSFSFFATAGAVVRIGATPVFVDIDPLTFNLDVEQVELAITDKTKAVIPVHLFGQSADLQALADLLVDTNIAIIEDAAQAIGAMYHNKRVGTFGRIGCYSFFPTKNLGAFGDGGLVVTDDESIADRLNLLRSHGARPKYHHEIVGGNFRLDSLQAAVLRAKLPYLEGWTAQRQRNAVFYNELLSSSRLTEDVLVLPSQQHGLHVYNQYVIRTPHRDALAEHLIENKIGCQIYYPEPLHRQPCFKDFDSINNHLPHTDKAVNEVLALPIYAELSTAELHFVGSTVINFLSSFE